MSDGPPLDGMFLLAESAGFRVIVDDDCTRRLGFELAAGSSRRASSCTVTPASLLGSNGACARKGTDLLYPARVDFVGNKRVGE